MAYYRSTPSSDSSEWRASHRRYASVGGSSTQESETESILISYVSPLTSPASAVGQSPRPTSSRPSSTASTERASHLVLNPAVTLSFTRGSRLFKLRYSSIDVYRNAIGDLKSIELNDHSRSQGSLSHQFPNAKQAIPHLEQPAASEKAALRVSFLGSQTISTTQNLFSAEPTYTFDVEQDCIRFQEALLQQQVVLVAGVAEIKSKGRGEECISQNLRVLRPSTGGFSLFYFANSQRKEKKRYVSIPLSAVERIEPGKAGSKSISIRLRASYDLLALLKTLQIKFLEESDYRTFYGVLCQVVGLHGNS